VEVTRAIASQAAQLRATRQIRLPDALILATAMQVAAAQILTLDRRWRGMDTRVRLLEP
jgi:predicted nucleic acid-binding protein